MLTYRSSHLISFEQQEFDFIPYVKKDMEHALQQLHRSNRTFFSTLFNKSILERVYPLVDKYCEGMICRKAVKDRIPTLVFPPGKVVHLYRDGYGWSAVQVPNDFFTEMDVHRRMVDDHLFDTGYKQSFLELMRQAKKDQHFCFEEYYTYKQEEETAKESGDDINDKKDASKTK